MKKPKCPALQKYNKIQKNSTTQKLARKKDTKSLQSRVFEIMDNVEKFILKNEKPKCPDLQKYNGKILQHKLARKTERNTKMSTELGIWDQRQCRKCWF